MNNISFDLSKNTNVIFANWTRKFDYLPNDEVNVNDIVKYNYRKFEYLPNDEVNVNDIYLQGNESLTI